jgi:fucose 4-O-acetylase-like acetyltransferase
MAFLIYIIALVITVLLMRVADLVHPTAGDIRIAVFLGVLFIVNFVLGMVPLGSTRRNP